MTDDNDLATSLGWILKANAARLRAIRSAREWYALGLHVADELKRRNWTFRQAPADIARSQSTPGSRESEE